MRKRQTTIIAVLSVLLVMALIGLLMLFFTPSSARPVSDAHPVTTSEVKSDQLSTTVVITGSIESSKEKTLSLPTAAEGASSVVSHTYTKKGDPMTVCSPTLEISGRPLFALIGDIPAYRDLHVGDTGRDVRQLQYALQACGYRIAADGVLGNHTKRAVELMYKQANYNKPHSSEEGEPDSQDSPPKQQDDSSSGQESSPKDNKPAAAKADKSLVLPQSEVVYVPKESRVVSIPNAGAHLSEETTLTVGVGSPSLVMKLTTNQALKLEEGAKVNMVAGDWEAHATMPAIPETPDSPDQSGGSDAQGSQEDGNGDNTVQYTVRIPLEKAPPPDVESVECSVVIGDETQYPKVVPATAVHYGDDTYVLIAPTSTDAKPKKVTVEVLATGDGQVAIKGDVNAGDKVITNAETTD